MGSEMSPVLSPSAGGLGTAGNRREVRGGVLGPGVGSVGRGCVDPGCRVEAGRGAVLTVGGAGEHTASMLALPGTATELQLRDNTGREGSAWPGSLRAAGDSQQYPGPHPLACRARPLDPCQLRWDPRTPRRRTEPSWRWIRLPDASTRGSGWGISGPGARPPGGRPPCSSRTGPPGHSHPVGPAGICG